MYVVRVAALAKSDIKVLPHKVRKLVVEILSYLSEDPFIGKPLDRELRGRYGYRVDNYRIVYKIVQKDKAVNILKVRHRSIAYN